MADERKLDGLKSILGDYCKVSDEDKDFANLLIDYVENCKSDLAADLIEANIRAMIQDEAQSAFFNFLKGVIKIL